MVMDQSLWNLAQQNQLVKYFSLHLLQPHIYTILTFTYSSLCPKNSYACWTSS